MTTAAPSTRGSMRSMRSPSSSWVKPISRPPDQNSATPYDASSALTTLTWISCMAGVLGGHLDEVQVVERQVRPLQLVGEQMGDAEDRPVLARRAEGLDGLVRATEHTGDELVDRRQLGALRADVRSAVPVDEVGDGH